MRFATIRSNGQEMATVVLPGSVVPVGEMDGTIPKASRSGWITKERGQRFPPYGSRVAELAHNTISFKCFYQPGHISFAIGSLLAELARLDSV